MSSKQDHEVRDPIHGFISYNLNERAVIDSPPFQRLRHIHQLALTYLVYPGTTHRRFEHSLGVMDLASRIYDELVDPDNLRKLPEATYRPLAALANSESLDRTYWRRAVRMGALCHDLGHLPFSHAAEKELLPPGTKHEHISWRLIVSDAMKPLWDKVKVRPEDVAKLAVGKKDAPPEVEFDILETLLAEIIVGDAFGADRIDYLLRDAYHSGVAYGSFDHLRLIKTLRILPKPQEGEEDDQSVAEPCIGIEKGGLQAAESLLWARYLMFSQVYLHPVRTIYDLHLKDFMLTLLDGDRFPGADVEKFLAITDIEVLNTMRQVASKVDDPLHIHAKRILDREHFKLVWERSAQECLANPAMGEAVRKGLEDKFHVDNVRAYKYEKNSLSPDFPVLLSNGEVSSAWNESAILQNMPPAVADYIFIEPRLRDKAMQWLERNRQKLAQCQNVEDFQL